MCVRKNNFFIYFFLLLVCISIGYAFLSASLTITGKSNIGKNTWDVHFHNIQIINGSVNASVEPVITNNTTIANFELILDKPGDFYEFTVDVENSGTIDAMIDSVVKTPDLTDTQKKYIDYIIEYQNGEEILKNQLVKADEFVRIKVRVEYKKDLSSFDLPTDSETLTLGLDINYVQADESGIFVSGRGFTSVEGNLNEIGTIVTIGTEKFYVIGTEGDNVKLLSMYNLYVGNELLGIDYENMILDMNPLAEPTGLQSSVAKGAVVRYVDDEENYLFPWIGITEFSNDDNKGTNYSDYNGSIVEEYVNDYKSILVDKFGLEVVDARLITKEELVNPDTFDCSEDDGMCHNNLYPWIYSTSYWTMTAYDDFGIWAISEMNSIYHDTYEEGLVGVRPVIEISKSEIFGRDDMIEFKVRYEEVNKMNIYYAEEGMTWEEWINSEYNVDGIEIYNDSVFTNDGYISFDGKKFVKPSDLVVDGNIYVSSWAMRV